MATKPIRTPKGFRLHFSFGGRQYKRFLIKNERNAHVLQGRINQLVMEFKQGLQSPPEGVSLPDFIFGSAVPRPDKEDYAAPSINTLLQLIGEYLKFAKPPAKAISTCETEAIHIKHLHSFLDNCGRSDVPLQEINIGFFDKYKIYRYGQDVRTDTVNKELGTFQAIFTFAVAHGHLPQNILKEVKRDESETPDERFHTLAEVAELQRTHKYSPQQLRDLKRFCYLTDSEINELLSLAVNKKCYPLLVAFAYTGMRRGESVKLEWADVDLEHKMLWLQSQKQSRRQQIVKRAVPIAPPLLSLLRQQKLQTGNNKYVFPGSNGEQMKVDYLRDLFRYLVKGTKFEGLGLHVFRHSLASNLATHGKDDRVIKKVLGHQSDKTLKRYQHLFPAQVETAMSSLQYVNEQPAVGKQSAVSEQPACNDSELQDEQAIAYDASVQQDKRRATSNDSVQQ